jgi:hypothetical protein
MFRYTSRITPNIHRILLEPFSVLSSLFSGVSNVSKKILRIVEPLSVFPYGSRMTHTWLRHSLINDHQVVLENNRDPRVFYEDVIVVWTITLSLIPFVLWYRHSFEMWLPVSRYQVRSRYRQCHSTPSRVIQSPWPSHMLRNVYGCNLKEWA